MLSFTGGLRVFLATEPCDMRKGFNGLYAQVTEQLGEDPRQQARVLDVPLVERHAFGDGEAEASDEVVDHRHRPAHVEQRQHRVAADVASAAGDEDGEFLRHGRPR